MRDVRQAEAVLTIGQVAKYAGVTIRAVRHYHQRGLLPEPARDSSGYRRYGAQDAVDLVKIRTLAEAGVPLARVRELMHADADDFAEAMAEIDAHLRDEVRRLKSHRKAIARLAGGEALGLPDEVLDFVARMRREGISEETIAIERDAWIIVAAHEPELAARWVTRKAAMFDDPNFAEIYRIMSTAATWSPDDPRLPQLADRLLEFVGHADAQESQEVLDPALLKVLNDHADQAAPAWKALNDMIVERLARQDSAENGAAAP